MVATVLEKVKPGLALKAKTGVATPESTFGDMTFAPTTTQYDPASYIRGALQDIEKNRGPEGYQRRIEALDNLALAISDLPGAIDGAQERDLTFTCLRSIAKPGGPDERIAANRLAEALLLKEDAASIPSNMRAKHDRIFAKAVYKANSLADNIELIAENLDLNELNQTFADERVEALRATDPLKAYR